MLFCVASEKWYIYLLLLPAKRVERCAVHFLRFVLFFLGVKNDCSALKRRTKKKQERDGTQFCVMYVASQTNKQIHTDTHLRTSHTTAWHTICYYFFVIISVAVIIAAVVAVLVKTFYTDLSFILHMTFISK